MVESGIAAGLHDIARRCAGTRVCVADVASSVYSACSGASGFLLVNVFSQVILKYAGSDCSDDLALHSPGAQALWRHYCIGRLRMCL